MSETTRDTVSPLRAGLTARCPRCGEGRLFDGFLEVVGRCPVCDLDFSGENAGDAPAVFIILFLGCIVVGLALWLETVFSPPLWLHAALWFPLILAASLGLLRPFKATMIALQYRHGVQFKSDHDAD